MRYDVETGFYYLQSRYYDPETCRFINADGAISGTGESVQGYNLFAYCFNNPVNMDDENGNWPKWLEKAASQVKKTLKKGYNAVKNFVKDNFGAGIVLSQSYKNMQVDTVIYGYEDGSSTSKVISGNISKPFSVYIETSSNLWDLSNYKVGVQINTDSGGVSFSGNLSENNLAFSNNNNSIEFIYGYNKFGYTIKSGVDFANRTAELYMHEYIRTIPAAVIVAGCYYTGGAAAAYLISIFGVGATCGA